jgi:hypothetical protein
MNMSQQSDVPQTRTYVAYMTVPLITYGSMEIIDIAIVVIVGLTKCLREKSLR